jgi:peroxiredoxin
MKTGISILAGLLAGVLVAVGVLAAFVLVGPDPVGLRPTPSPTLVPSVAAPPSASPSVAPSASPSLAPSASPSEAASGSPGTAFRIGQPAPPLVVSQVGGGTIDLATLKGKAVWLDFVQTTCSVCGAEFPLMNDFGTRYEKDGLVVIAVDVKEDEAKVAAFAVRLDAKFPIGLDADGKAQQAWGATTLPTHVWIDTLGVIRAGALGGAGADVFAANLRIVLPGVTITP